MSEPGSAAPARPVWGVAALLQATGDALATRFGSVTVRGEVSGFARAASGHCYFALKDSAGAPALLRCAMFRRAATLLDFSPADGQQVDLRGRLGVYDARGELQLIVEAMQRVGAGSLYEEFLRLRARLQAQGLFDAARKRPITAHPQAVGVITSPAAAALRDVLTSLARRAPQVRVVIYPSPVQGSEAPAALAAALQLAGERAEVQTLLLVRGGGSLEDLWAFNDERVVRAVAACPLPVICGVGHETDISLCDLAADLRAPTPTAAAELAAPARADALAALDTRADALGRRLRRALDAQAQRLDTLALRLQRPAAALAGHGQRLQATAARLRSAAGQHLGRQALQPPALAERLQRAAAVHLQRQQQRLDAAARRLDALDPRQVLRRGYAWVEDAAGRPVSSVRALAAGQAVQAVWADGRAWAQVQRIDADALPPTSPPSG
jgi:exodeoxyribonuclease VII large subunit